MNYKKYLILFSALLIYVGVNAQTRNIIKLKNGDSFVGYVNMQDKEGNIGIAADTSVVSIPLHEVKNIEHIRDPKNNGDIVNISLKNDFDSISKIDVEIMTSQGNWKKWNDFINGVELVNDGSIVTFRSVRPLKAIVPPNEIEYIQTPLPDQDEFPPVIDEITTRDGRVLSGLITGVQPGELIKILTGKNTHVVKQGDILIQRRQSSDKEDILNVTPLLDNIYLNDGSYLSNVLIIEQNSQNGTFTTIDENSHRSVRPLSEISKIEHVKNPNVKPAFKYDFNGYSVYVNSTKIQEIPFKFDNGKIIFDIPSQGIQTVAMSKDVTIDMENTPTYRNSYLLPLKNINEKVVSMSVNRLLSDKITEENQETLKNKMILRRVYRLSPGVYGFFNYEVMKVALFRVTK